MKEALAALETLKAGNRRFVEESRDPGNLTLGDRRKEVASGQSPFAVILGCADSRVPAETLFDQGLGDLFVVRVAGNIAEDSQVGSIEFAVEQLGSRLVVVLGHSQCGAVAATLQVVGQGADPGSRGLRRITDLIGPVVEPLMQSQLKDDPEQLLNRAVRDNVSATAEQLRTQAELLKPWLDKGELLIVGAEYDLETGEVDFFDGLPEDRSA